MKTKRTPSSRAGFGLVELLMTIAILGIMVSLLLPHLTANSTYREVRDHRNAQELSSFTSAAQAAGLELVVPGDIKATLENVLKGGSPSAGAFKGRQFVAPRLSSEDLENAARFLEVKGNHLLVSTKPKA